VTCGGFKIVGRDRKKQIYGIIVITNSDGDDNVEAVSKVKGGFETRLYAGVFYLLY
jgi:hypothetical protein